MNGYAVTVRKKKYDGSTARQFTGEFVDGTEDGWLVVFRDAALHESFKRGEPDPMSPYIVMFFATHLPVVVSFFYDDRGDCFKAQVDSSLPTEVRGAELSFVDLDLDYVIPAGEAPYDKDEDELAQHRLEMAIPDDVIETAWEGLRLGHELHEARAYPFDGSAGAVLGRVLASRGPL